MRVAKCEFAETEIGSFPADWDIVSLSELASFKTGPFGSRLHKSDYIFDGVPVINPMHIENGTLVPSKHMTVTSSEADALKDYRLCGGDVIIGRRGEMGRCAVVREMHEGWICGTGSLIVRPSRSVDAFFLQRILASPEVVSRITDSSVGSTMLNLNHATLAGLKVQRPPLAEQRAIAEALSDADALIHALDALITKKRHIKQGTMQQLLTGKKRLPGFTGEWEETTLGEVGECVIGLTYKPSNVTDHGLLVLRSSNIQNNRLAFEDNVYVNMDVPENIITRDGDILICVRNGSRALIGKCVRLGPEIAGQTFGAFMSIYRTKYSRFIGHLFRSFQIQRQINENLGATINQITNKVLKSFEVKLPDVDEQEEIANVLDDMDAEITALEQKRDKTKLIKQGMMQELLTGKTRLI